MNRAVQSRNANAKADVDLKRKFLARLKRARSIVEWNRVCAQARSEFGGKLPLWWRGEVINSGLMDAAAKRWGLDSKLGKLSPASSQRVRDGLV